MLKVRLFGQLWQILINDSTLPILISKSYYLLPVGEQFFLPKRFAMDQDTELKALV